MEKRPAEESRTDESARAERIVIKSIRDIEDKEIKKENSLFLPFILEYKQVILDEFNEKCQNAINLIELYIYHMKKIMKLKELI